MCVIYHDYINLDALSPVGGIRYYIGMENEQSNSVFRAIQLALLEKSDEEQVRFGGEVEKILAFVSDVQSIDAEDVAGVVGSTNVFRDDVVTVESELYREELLAQAPNVFKQYFLSKKILE